VSQWVRAVQCIRGTKTVWRNFPPTGAFLTQCQLANLLGIALFNHPAFPNRFNFIHPVSQRWSFSFVNRKKARIKKNVSSVRVLENYGLQNRIWESYLTHSHVCYLKHNIFFVIFEGVIFYLIPRCSIYDHDSVIVDTKHATRRSFVPHFPTTPLVAKPYAAQFSMTKTPSRSKRNQAWEQEEPLIKRGLSFALEMRSCLSALREERPSVSYHFSKAKVSSEAPAGRQPNKTNGLKASINM